MADCFRFRRHVGLEVALSALKDDLTNRKGSIDGPVEAARADRIYTFMRPWRRWHDEDARQAHRRRRAQNQGMIGSVEGAETR